MLVLILAIVILGGFGLYLAMPRGGSDRLSLWAWAPAAAALLLLWMFWIAGFENAGAGRALLFLPLATLSVVGAFMMVTRRNPVAVALWFATVVLGVAGLMLLLGAQFIAAATVIVYAGAVLVMFLFVIMVAGQRGREYHDRVSRDPELAVGWAAALLALMLLVLASSYGGVAHLWPGPESMPERDGVVAMRSVAGRPHVAPLGRALFGMHWLSVELAGTLLLVALVAAVLIVGAGSARRP